MNSSGDHTARHPSRQQLAQRARVELVCLDLGLGDRTELARVGDHRQGDVRFQNRRDLECWFRGLLHHLMVRREALREQFGSCRELDGGRIVVWTASSARGRASAIDIRHALARGASVVRLERGQVMELVLYFTRDRALADRGLEE